MISNTILCDKSYNELTKAENLRSSLFFFFGDNDATLFFIKCLKGDYNKMTTI